MATTAKYVRLSSEDDDLRQGGKLESNSIANQRDLLDAFISRMPELAGTNIIEFCDDGWSGKNFERPAVQEMIAQARAGKIQCIVVKDLSRFGRDYLTVGSYISSVFPFLGVRFIAVNDGYDSIRPMDVDSLDTFCTTFTAVTSPGRCGKRSGSVPSGGTSYRRLRPMATSRTQRTKTTF